VRIPMSDGVTLAADCWFPDAPGKFPVVLEYLPYPKSDIDWAFNDGMRYLAERGFVTVRLDARGTGDSQGTALDEYCPQEQLDGVEAIAWLAAQPWSTGKVAMMGSSYGGFTAIQVAMRRPPALKAIAPMYFTDRRYTDDCHYKGGALQMLYDVANYSLQMTCRSLLPPRRELVGEQWVSIWNDHLKNEPWLLRWLEHQTEDEYWRHGSLCENYSAIEAATLMIGGWRDGYVNANLRTFAHLTCPKKLIMGPWLHVRPASGVPGPRMNHWREVARFFGCWLMDLDNGVMDEPPIAIYVQQWDEPRSDRMNTRGFWRFESEWPPRRAYDLRLYLSGVADTGTLTIKGPPKSNVTRIFAHTPSVGSTFGPFPAADPLMLPGDQRIDEGYSLLYTSAALDEPTEILGHPRVTLYVESTAQVMNFVARLCDVAPDGSSALVTRGVLNATHRNSHSSPEALVPGDVYLLEIELDATSWIFEPSHRIRLAITSADFPNIWPSPFAATNKVHSGRAFPSMLLLPALGAAPQDLPTPEFESVATPSANLPAPAPSWRVTRDVMSGSTELRIQSESSTLLDDGITVVESREAVAVVSDRDPGQAYVQGLHRVSYESTGKVEARARAEIQSDSAMLHVAIHAEMTVDGMPHFNRAWLRSYRRSLL